MKKHEREHMRSMIWRIISEKDDVLRRILDLSKLKENSSWDLIFEIFVKKEKINNFKFYKSFLIQSINSFSP